MKIKKLLLSLVLIMSMFFAVACGDKEKDPEETPQKSDPTISVSVGNRNYYKGEVLNDITLIVASGGTSGIVVWSDGSQVLAEGENSCEWTFTPTDTEKYNSKTGTIVITAIKLEIPEVSVSLKPGQTIYIDSKLKSEMSHVELEASASFGGQNVEGTIAWKEPSTVLTSGENTCEWIFKPTDTALYQNVSGTIKVNATEEQTPQAISVIENTKTDYVAFDTFDKSKVTVCLLYNAGKVEEIQNKQSIAVYYENGESFRRGDTKVELKYENYPNAVVEGLTVDYKLINNPTFTQTYVYNGYSKILQPDGSDDSNLYTYDALTKTDAGEYDLQVTLLDSDNYKWINGDEISTIVVCKIQKAEIEAVVSDYSEEYDGGSHFVTITNSLSKDVHYSETELTESNYTSAPTETIEKTNAGTYVIYYFIAGDNNYKNKAGSFTINISKQTPTISLETCYTLKTGAAVNYPTSYVSVTDKASVSLEVSGLLKITYYASFTDDGNSSNDVKTNSSNAGAATEGGAPKTEGRAYYAVVEFLGNQNFNNVADVAQMYIDKEDLDFYATGSQKAFAFKGEDEFQAATNSFSNGTSIISLESTGSNAECEAYIEFDAKVINSDGLRVVEFIAKFGSGAVKKKQGKLVFVDGVYQLLCSDGEILEFSYNTSEEKITVEKSTSEEVVLCKWEIPSYLKTFTAVTVSDDDYNEEYNTSKNTTITFYNDYGTIRFTADVNVKRTGGKPASGGHETWLGVAEISISRINNSPYYILTCYTTEYSDGYPEIPDKTMGFIVRWCATEDANNEPSQIEVYNGIGTHLASPYDALLYNSTLAPVFVPVEEN